MPAIVSSAINRWRDHVPYVISEAMPRIWLLGKVLEFNTRVGRNVFVGRTNEPNYACFVPGAHSPVGMQGGKQDLKCNKDNLFHEMGHCVGLGHTYFHSRAELPGLFEGVDQDAYRVSRGGYADQGFADVDSMMGYTPQSFGGSPRIKRVCVLCSNNQALLPQGQGALQTLISLRRQPEPASRVAKFQMGGQIPIEFRNHLMHFKIGGDWSELRINDYEGLRALDPNDLAQFAADLTIVKRYWRFSAGFMLRVSDDDVQAIRAVLRP